MTAGGGAAGECASVDALPPTAAAPRRARRAGALAAAAAWAASHPSELLAYVCDAATAILVVAVQVRAAAAARSAQRLRSENTCAEASSAHCPQRALPDTPRCPRHATGHLL